MHHGSRDLQGGVAFILHAVHLLDGTPSERVDQDPGGLGGGHVLHLQGAKTPPRESKLCSLTLDRLRSPHSRKPNKPMG